MLDTDHPQAPYIFAASHQLDEVLWRCKQMTVRQPKDRRFTLEMMRAEFAALRWLAEHHFQDDPILCDDVAELERAAEKLAELRLNKLIDYGEATSCPVCNDHLTEPSKYDPTSYCSSCLDIIMPSLCSCRERFGTEAI